MVRSASAWGLWGVRGGELDQGIIVLETKQVSPSNHSLEWSQVSVGIVYTISHFLLAGSLL